MKIKPDLRVWAECLVETVKYNSLTVEQLVDIVEDNLDEIADKYYQMGFDDGDKNGWWEEQEETHRKYSEVINLIQRMGNEHSHIMCSCHRCNGDPK